MRVTIRKWGNSAAIRIPTAVMDAGKLQLDRVVDIREEKGCVVIEPVREDGLSLDELVSGITPENRHDVVNFGRVVGNEAL